jgi:hypothetical protein
VAPQQERINRMTALISLIVSSIVVFFIWRAIRLGAQTDREADEAFEDYLDGQWKKEDETADPKQQLRWRRKESYELRQGERVLATVTQTEDGWYWYGMQENTASSPSPDLAKVKADAETHVRLALAAADRTATRSGGDAA